MLALSAIFNEQTLLSLLKAKHREQAHFDDETLAELARLDEDQRKPASRDPITPAETDVGRPAG